MADAEGQSLGKMFVQVGADTSDIHGGIDGISEQFDNLVKLFTLGAGVDGILELGKAFLEASSETEQAGMVFGQSLGAIGIKYDDVASSAENYFSKLSDIYGFQKDEFESSTAHLIQITQNYSESLKLVSLASEVARGSGMNLQSASTLLGQVYEGNTSRLRHMGIVLAAGTSATEAFAAIQARFAGSGATYMETYAGQVAKFGNKWNDIKIILGQEIEPVIEKLMTSLEGLMGDVKTLVQDFNNLNPAARGFTVVAIPLTAAIYGLSTATKLWTTSLEGAALAMAKNLARLTAFAALIAAAGASVVWFYENFSKLGDLVKEVLYGMLGDFMQWGVKVDEVFANVFGGSKLGNWFRKDAQEGIAAMNDFSNKSDDAAKNANSNWVSYQDIWEQTKGVFIDIGNQFGKTAKDIAADSNKSAKDSEKDFDSLGQAIENIGLQAATGFAKDFSSSFQIFEKGTFDMKAAFEKMIDDMIQKIIESGILNLIGLIFNVVPTGGLGILGNLFGGSGGGQKAGAPYMAADGGVFTKPTFAVIGEAGPEAVIPLNQLSGMMHSGGEGQGQTIVSQVFNVTVPSMVNTMDPGSFRTTFKSIADGLKQIGAIQKT